MSASRMRRRANAGRKVLTGQFCIYCGVAADSRDHYPPVSTGYQAKGFILPACRECNAIATDSHPQSLAERVEYVKAKLGRKYAKLLAMPKWREDELSEMSEAMGQGLRESMSLQRKARARIEWDSFKYLVSIGLDL